MQRSREAWVVDASVATKWYLQDEDWADEARALWNRYEERHLEIFAPHVSRHEVGNSINVAAWLGRISGEQAWPHIENYLRSGISLERDPDWLLKQAAAVGLTYRISFYDATYIALAEHLGTNFVTDDRKLHAAIAHALPFVVLLANLEI